MKLGISLFKDKYVREFISQFNYGCCDLTKKNEIVYDTEESFELQNMFVGVLELLEESNSPNSRTLYELFDNWNTFNKKDYIYTILEELLIYELELDSNLLNKKFIVSNLNDNSILTNKTWNEFVEDLKYNNRFFGYKNLNENALKNLFECFIVSFTNKRVPFFRTRICSREKKEGYHFSEMGPPPVEYAVSGRISAEGIRCLYLSNNMETSLAETRVRNYDKVSVGRFIISKSILLVDLSNVREMISPFGFRPNLMIANYQNLIEIIDCIEKPIRPFDTKLDYLPSQIICAFMKEVLNVDGIKYNSTLAKNGINIALFNYEKMKCTNVYQYYVESTTNYRCINIK